MKAFTAAPPPRAPLLGLVLGGLLIDVSTASVAKPVQKAVEMLEGMLTKAENEKHEEQVQFAGFKQFCDDVTHEKQIAIAQADAAIEKLEADVLKYNTEVDRLTGEIEDHVAELVQYQNDTEASQVVHVAERAEFMATHRNYTESVDALERAIQVLKAQAHDTAGVYALLQKVRNWRRLPLAAGRTIAAFLARSTEDPDLVFVPPVTAYEYKSGDIISMLEGLLTKFRGEVVKLEEEETARHHSYEMLMQSLTDSSKAAEAAKASKAESKVKNEQLSASSTAELKDVTTARADDAKYLEDLTATCEKKSKDYESRQKLRIDEISALGKAIEILSSATVAGAAERHLYNATAYVPTVEGNGSLRSGVPGPRFTLSFLQMSSVAQSPNQVRAAAYLWDAGERLKSKALSVLAANARDDPFKKVKKIIEELITRLMAQATAEAEHKGWCDTELATNEHTRTSKSHEIEMLSAEIDSLVASAAQDRKDLARLTQEVQEIEAAVAEATDMRNAEQKHSNTVIEEATAAQAAVADAIKLLKDFYAAAAANATAGAALLQDSQTGAGTLSRRQLQEPPAIFGDEAYAGQQDATTGVIGMLEVIQADFARLESETQFSEQNAATEYDRFMEDSAVSKTEKDTTIKHKTQDEQDKVAATSEKHSSLSSAQEMLSNAQATFERLKPVCLEEGQTYDERKTRREDEIAALKEALRILSGDDAVIR
jgi:hypothetical protein